MRQRLFLICFITIVVNISYAQNFTKKDLAEESDSVLRLYKKITELNIADALQLETTNKNEVVKLKGLLKTAKEKHAAALKVAPDPELYKDKVTFKALRHVNDSLTGVLKDISIKKSKFDLAPQGNDKKPDLLRQEISNLEFTRDSLNNDIANRHWLSDFYKRRKDKKKAEKENDRLETLLIEEYNDSADVLIKNTIYNIKGFKQLADFKEDLIKSGVRMNKAVDVESYIPLLKMFEEYAQILDKPVNPGNIKDFLTRITSAEKKLPLIDIQILKISEMKTVLGNYCAVSEQCYRKMEDSKKLFGNTAFSAIVNKHLKEIYQIPNFKKYTYLYRMFQGVNERKGPSPEVLNSFKCNN